jgi:hypothetical protein
MALQLAVVTGECQGVVHTIAEDRPVRIGRNPENDVVLTDPTVSRRHAELTVEGGHAWLRHLGSNRNGTRIADCRLPRDQRFDIVPGCEIHVASVCLHFREGGPMTVGQWRISRSPRHLLEHVLPGANQRQLAFFVRACARRFAPRLVESASGHAPCTLHDDTGESLALAGVWWATISDHDKEGILAMNSEGMIPHARQAAGWRLEDAWTCDLLRELFGDPFDPVEIDPVWLHWGDGTVPRLARAIQDEEAFDRLPILADALEDAGCDRRAILDHCRGPGPHHRGCWVLNRLLGMG